MTAYLKKPSHQPAAGLPGASSSEELRRVVRLPGASESVRVEGEARQRFGFGRDRSLVGDVVRVGNANAPERSLVTWRSAEGADGNAEFSEWLRALEGLILHVGDRVLLEMPGNMDAPIVVGVVDGPSARSLLPADSQGHVVLRAGECLRVDGPGGRPLLEIISTEAGAVLRLAEPDLRLEVPGTLSLRASEVEVTASEGDVRIRANDDVAILGERVRLN